MFLDVPRLVCLRREIARAVHHRGRTRDDVAPGCPERLDLEFARWVWSYPLRVRPLVLERLAEFERLGGRAVTLRNAGEARAFVAVARTATAGRPGVVSIAGQ